MLTRIWSLGITAAWGILALSSPAFADTPVDSPFELEACFVSLTTLGRQARFQDAVVYALETDDKGRAGKISLQRPPLAKSAFIDLTELEACLRRWRLAPKGRYNVTFQYGTSGEYLHRWLLHVLGPSLGSLRLSLPRDR